MRSTLLERDDALAAIRRAVEGAQTGGGRALFVVGEAGIGKTVLLEQGVMATVAESAGTPIEVGVVRGDEMEMVLPFAAIVGLLDGLGERAVIDGIINTDGPVIEPAAPLYRLGRWLDERRDRPTVLVVDDLHWTDTDSRLALAFLARRLRSTSVSLVATVRPWPEEALELARALEAGSGAEVIELEPLSKAGAGELLQMRSRFNVAEPLRREAWKLCQGNPLLTEQVALAIGRGEPLPEIDEHTSAFASSIVLSRFAGLDRTGLELVRAACVLGTSFRAEVAAEIARVPESRTAEVIRALTRSGLIDGDRHGQRFAHPLFAQALYHDLGPVMRAHLHGRCFSVLMRRGLEAEALSHAAGADLAGDRDAIAALLRAGRAAMDVGAVAMARRHLETAVSLSGDTAEPALLMAYAEALASAGEMQGSAAALRQVLSSQELPPDVRSDAWRMLGRSLYLTGSPDHGDNAFREAVELALAHDPERAILAMLDQSLSAWLAGGCTLALPIAERARSLASKAAAAVRERADATWAHLALDAGDPDGLTVSQPLLRRAVALRAGAVQPSDSAWPWASLALLANNAMHAEQFDEAEVALAMAREAADRAGTPNAVAVQHIYAANLVIRRGRLHDALQHATQAAAFSELTPGVIGYSALARAEALLWGGDMAGSEAACLEAEQATAGQWFAQFWRGHVRGLALLWAGRPSASDEFLAVEAAGRAAGIGEPCLMHWGAHAVEAHVLAGRSEDAGRVTEWLEDCGRVLPCRFPRLAAHVGRAHQAWGRQEPELALDELASAVALHREVDLPLLRIEALLTYGRFLRLLGRAVDSRAPLAEATTLAEQTGAAWLEAQARTELSLAGGRRRRSGSRAPTDLTTAERRVADLAAEGRTNAEIAAQLFISVNTVETHLRHIYAKLGIGSRRALAGLRGSAAAGSSESLETVT